MSYINFYACCHITKGFTYSIITDLERGIYFSFPTEYFEILSQKNLSVQNNPHSSDPYFQDLLNFLEKNKFIYQTQQKENISVVNTEFILPYEIEDIIIDASNGEDLNYKTEKIDIFCETIQFRIYGDCTVDNLYNSINNIRAIGILSIEIIINYNEQLITQEDYADLYQKNNIISRIIVMNSPEAKKAEGSSILFTTSKLSSCDQCGIISESLFMPNQRTFLTSKKFNSCLNKKLSIDINGEIKNCPSMKESFGNISEISLSKASGMPSLKKYWNVKKDDIEVCKDCEFRYICTDCRAYTRQSEIVNDIDYSKPLKCSYDPYEGKWFSEKPILYK
ncbi:grasp-with-spasm system SPASM domain peptide maturase [Chryseobacterium profundimaris]|uniref:SPASM domain peptide maturase, grasp-with-spasm system n=1 Tax=Chryseobacterium profundimaris TaxID=1387275 RepID=A0ABY1NDG8_9FLAO|nr:grasp-with-spasm system SPASM domain peptide maturase [Chryseobacterium profundimaris]SMP06303.1 SPASM domain peptide maturase, grasp-with-spasm system [Chryseobacterium profundimaris]